MQRYQNRNLSSWSFSGENFSNFRRNLDKSSSTNDFNSDNVLSQLSGDVTFKSTKHFKSIFHFWSSLSLSIEIILEGSKTFALQRIFDPRGLLSKSFSRVAIMYLWQSFFEFFNHAKIDSVRHLLFLDSLVHSKS